MQGISITSVNAKMPQGILTNATQPNLNNLESKRISVPNTGIADFSSNSSSQMNQLQYNTQ